MPPTSVLHPGGDLLIEKGKRRGKLRLRRGRWLRHRKHSTVYKCEQKIASSVCASVALSLLRKYGDYLGDLAEIRHTNKMYISYILHDYINPKFPFSWRTRENIMLANYSVGIIRPVMSLHCKAN